MRARIMHGCCRGWSVALWIALAMAAPAPALRADDAGILNAALLDTTDGEQIYAEICQGCHMSGAQGAVGAGQFPALAKDGTLASRQYMALTVLRGRRNMPAFGATYAIGFGGPPATLTEEQIAAVVNYVRSHFGNHYTDLITAAEIRALDQDVR
jgi:mono/diheme cytochrome c family protein